MQKNIRIIGGDERNYILAKKLKDDFNVKIYENGSIEDFLKNADLVVGGIPFSRDGEFINAPRMTKKINIKEIFDNIKNTKKLLAGSFSDEVIKLANEHGIIVYDFLDDEDFAIYNAIPTAEGAIEIALRETRKTINKSNCLVLGYGRIGKCLADLLKGLHANVNVVARKDKDFAWIDAYGYRSIKYAELDKILPHIDIIFNTVPSLVLKEELNYVKKECLIIELASKPGGIDFEFAKEKGIRVELALGLPGKVAPESVADYMVNKVKKVI